MAEIVPVEVFPLASYLWEEMQARGWNTDDVAARMPADNARDAAVNLITTMMILSVQKDGCLVGDEMFSRLAAAFDVSEQLFRNLDAMWRKWPDSRIPFECPDEAFGPSLKTAFQNITERERQMKPEQTALFNRAADKADQYLAEKRKARELKKHLTDLTIIVTKCLAAIDAEMCKPSSPERGSRIAKISNALNLQNDIAKRFGLGQR